MKSSRFREMEDGTALELLSRKEGRNLPRHWNMGTLDMTTDPILSS
jgi:hypothetical protein